MAFHNVVYPLAMQYGSEFGLTRSNSIIQRPSGTEQRNAHWSADRRVYNVAQNVRTRANLTLLRNFWRARGASLFSWPLKDPEDFSTASDGIGTRTGLDHVIGTGDGTTVDFQLITRYSDAEATEIRTIELPKPGTVIVAVDGTVKTEGTHYTVNYVTGVVTFSGGFVPTAPQNITAGCEFYVPVRFGSDQEAQFRSTHTDFDVVSIVVPAIEVFGGIEINDDAYRGGGSLQAVTADLVLDQRTMGEAIRLQPTAARTCYLGSAVDRTCGAHHSLWNDNASAYTITVKSGGTTVGTIAAGVTVEAHVFKSSTSQVWKLF